MVESPKRGKLTLDERRERKRAMDREAQRNLREKTKNRIATLEALVRTLQDEKSGNKRIHELIAQLHESQSENQNLRNTISGIEKLLSRSRYAGYVDGTTNHPPSRGTEARANTSGFSEYPTHRRLATSTAMDSKINLDFFDMAAAPPKPQPSLGHPYESLPPPQATPDLRAEILAGIECASRTYPEGIAEPLGVDPNAGILSEISHAINLASPPNQRATLIPPPDYSLNGPDPLFQMSRMIMGKQVDGKFWYLANETLQYLLARPTYAISSVEADEDITIRAFLHGWPAVERKYQLDGCWKWLRILDSYIFSHLGLAERASILRLTRLNVTARCRRILDEDAPVPPFINPSLAQINIDHDPLVDLFAWPGVREHMIFRPSDFICDRFTDAFRSNYLFVWNHGMDEICFHDPATGRYRFTPLWHRHLNDLRCFQLRPGFFEVFPNLRSVVPCAMTLCWMQMGLAPQCCGDEEKGVEKEERAEEPPFSGPQDKGASNEVL